MCVCVRVRVRVHHLRPPKLQLKILRTNLWTELYTLIQEGTDILNTPYDRTNARDDDDEEGRDA